MDANTQTTTTTTTRTKMTKEEYNARKRAKYHANEETRRKQIDRVKEWKADHKDNVAEANKTYYEAHKEELLAKAKQYKKDKKDEINARRRAHYAEKNAKKEEET